MGEIRLNTMLKVYDETKRDALIHSAIRIGRILLENKRKAKKIFENMVQEEQRNFMEFPIYHIWADKDNEDAV